jgi:hypothetical protein
MPMSSRKIITLFVGLEVLIVVVGLLFDGYTLTALQTITRFSGRLSLFLFSAIFLLYNKPSTISVWLSEKFYLLFAVVHGIHLVELLSFVYLSESPLIPHRVAGGFLAYVYIFSMPVLQHLRDRGRVSPKAFSTLETIFIYYVWLIFFLTYLPRVQGRLPQAGGSFGEHVALLGWISALLGMKLTGLIRFQQRKTD